MAEVATSKDNQYLTFSLDHGLFALDIASVHEVLELVDITRIPRTPDYIRGVINLRGRALPVVDLKMMFGMGATARTVSTCVIITEIFLGGESTVLGVLADSVQEVYDMEPSQIEPPPRMGTPIRVDFILGIGRTGEQFIIILDINKVFSCDELAGLAQALENVDAEMIKS